MKKDGSINFVYFSTYHQSYSTCLPPQVTFITFISSTRQTHNKYVIQVLVFNISSQTIGRTHGTISPHSTTYSLSKNQSKAREEEEEEEEEEEMATQLSSAFKMILGSSSMARRKILTEMGYKFIIMTADIDEKGIRREKPEDLVMALAEAKADAIISKLRLPDFQRDHQPTLLITADTVVVHDGVVREKPADKEEARRFIKGYSGGHTSVVGSVLVNNLKTGVRKGGYDRVEVYFHEIPDEIIDNLVEEGIVLNVAGGLMLEHPWTLPFVEAVMGTADSVMGLSKFLTEKLIQEVL